MPETTKKFFESILRTSDDNPSLVVNKVLVRQIDDNKRHFNSGQSDEKQNIKQTLNLQHA